MTRTLASRYELTSPIGRGGMGEVWAAYDKRLDRPVAVKLLRADVLPAGDHITIAKRFVRESRLTARVEHPGVPAVFDAGSDGDRLYLVMQLVPGIDLADHLTERAPLPLDAAVAVAAQIGTVLVVAHAASLVHRDLKPRNVMIRPDGTVVLLDFGVAALLDPDITRLTTTGEMLGSPAYMSPEQVIGGSPSPRSDLYALGCILHEMLTGSRPFVAEGSFEAMRRHVEEPPPPVRSLRTDIPETIEALVLDLLAKNPSERPADAQEVYERLSPYLPVPGTPAPDTALDPTRPYRRPHAPDPRSSKDRRRATALAIGGSESTAEHHERDVARLRAEAADVAEAGRFTQAAELLAGVLIRLGTRAARPEGRGVRLQLANTLLLGGDFAAALPEYERLIAEVSRDRGNDDPDVLAWQVQAAICQDALGETADALARLVPILEIRQRRLGSVAPEVVELRRQVALLRASSGDSRRAVDELRELKRELDSGNPIATEIAETLRRLGK